MTLVLLNSILKKYISILFLILFCINYGNSCQAQRPFKLSSPGDIITIGLTIPSNIAGSHFYKKKKPLTEEKILALDINSINRFDRSAVYQYSLKSDKVSDVLLVVCAFTPALLLFDNEIRNDASIPLVMYIEAAGITTAEIHLIKGLFDKPRPFVYNANVPMNKKVHPDANCSFISGHTAMATVSCFFAAGILEGYHPDTKNWIWFAAAVPALTTGFFRYKAGKHFFSDILAGFVVGSVNGYLVTHLH